jgi:hypothetical protein
MVFLDAEVFFPCNILFALSIYMSYIFSLMCFIRYLFSLQGNHMYAEISEKLVAQFIDLIKEGSIYEIRKFFVVPKKIVFRPVDGKAMIRFTKYTSVVERLGLEAMFPFCTYQLTPFAQLTKPSDMPERFTGFYLKMFLYMLFQCPHAYVLSFLISLTDVLGVVSGISDAVQYHSASRTEPSTKRIIYIKDLS